ncbi:TolC family protein [Wenyingzhuangia sp. IMCC45467]
MIEFKYKKKKRLQLFFSHFSLTTFHLKKWCVLSFSLFTIHLATAQSIESYISEALENNPTIKKFEWKHKLMQEKTNEVNNIPNTEFGLGYFVSKPETRVGAQDFKMSVKQMFPWFGTITSRENYANAVAEVSYEDIAIAHRKLVLDVHQSYYSLYTLKEQNKIIDENLALLKVYETMALASVESGKATVVQVLRIQMRENELIALKQELLETYASEKTAFSKLLNRNSSDGITVVDTLKIPKQEHVVLDSLNIHPELIKFDKLYASVEKSELLNQKNKAPMLGVGLDYISVTERPNMTLADNGKDILMPMVTLSIPIFNKKYNSITKQNQLAQKEIVSQKRERQNKLETLLSKAVHQKISAKKSYDLQLQNIIKTKNAEEILIKKYETENIDFYEVLELQQLQLKFQMNQIAALKKYFMAETVINYLSK